MANERRSTYFKIKTVIAVLGTLGILSCASLSHALPVNGNVAGGNAIISSPSSTVTQINQTSNRAVIDWHSYNINKGETVHYQQPNSSSITLNRIDPSQGVSKIYGSIQANGQVWLVNPAGIWFGAGSYVNVSGLIATTSSIKTDDFMAGNYHFKDSSAYEGSITNEGTIIVKNNGLAALVGSNVTNTGLIVANRGTVVLGASKKFTVDFNGDHLVNFEVGGEVANPKINQSGKIIANGGKVVMTAKTASRVLDDTISMKGVVVAKSVYQHNGEIILDGGQGGVKISGKLIASSRGVNQRAGKIKVYANRVRVHETAKIDVTGDAGAGNIDIRSYGDLNSVVVDAGAKIDASAVVQSQGGNINIQSDNNEVNISGELLAKGGEINGKGGLITIDAGREGTVYSFANINVSAEYANGLGGVVKVLGKNVGLMSGSIINASGDAGGGEVLIGGNAHGVGPEYNATAVYMDQNAYIYSNGLSTGYGGKVVLWSDEVTNFYGFISARGGVYGGNGGWVETSGKHYLNAQGMVDAAAPNGAAGFWLLDPTNVVISSAAQTNISQVNGNPRTFDPVNATPSPAIVNVTNIINALNAGTSVTVTTNSAGGDAGDITVNANISKTAGGAATLTLTTAATGTITINNPITSTVGALSIDLNGGTSVVTNAALNSNGGVISISSSGTNTIGAALSSSTGNISINGATNNINANITTNGGQLTITANGGATNVADNITINTDTAILGITGSGLQLGVNSRLLTGTTGAVNIATTGVSADATSQIGGTGAGTGTSLQVTFQPNTGSFQTFGVGGGSPAGSYQIPQSVLNSVRAQTLRIGGAGNTGTITVGTLTQPTNVTNQIIFGTRDNVIFTGDVSLSVPLTINAGTFSGGSTVALNSGVTINTDVNDINFNIGANGQSSGTLSLAANAQLLSRTDIFLRVDNITTTATSQIGGSGTGAGRANNVILAQVNFDRSVSINSTTAAGLGTNTLIVTPTTLDIIRTQNLRIGNENATSGNMVITAWTPGSNYLATGTLSLNTPGNITQTGGGFVLGSLGTNLPRLLFRAGGNVTLNNANNDIGLISGTAGGSFSLTNTSGAPIAIRSFTDDVGTTTGINVGALTLTTSGAGATITQNAPIVATSAILTAGANAITLNNASNDFTGNVRFTNSGANAISLVDSNSLSLGLSTVGSGTVTLTANNGSITFANTFTASGDLILSATTSIGANFSGIINADAVTATAETGIALSNDNTISQFTATNTSGNISLTNTGSITLNNISTNGSITINNGTAAVGTPISINGTISTAGGSSNDIIINNIQGAITETATGLLSSSGAITISTTVNNITLNQLNLSNAAAGSTVSLSTTGAGNIAYTDSSAVTFGNISLGSGTLSLTATGALSIFSFTQAPGTSIVQTTGAGAVTLTNSNASGGINLTNTGNDFRGVVTATVSAGNNISITDTNAINLGAITLTSGGSLAVIANAGVTPGASGIFQSGALSINGTSSFNSGAGAITLANVNNNFTGAVSVNNSGANNITLTDLDAIVLGTSSVGTGTLTVNAIGISQTGPITQAASAGAAIFNSGAGTLNLTNVTNNFTGSVSLNTTGSASASILDNAGGLILGNSTIAANLNVTVNGTGTLTQAASTAITVPGTLTITNGTGAITLNNSGNLLTTLGAITGGALTINDSAGGLTVNGAITTPSATISTVGLLSLSGTGDITTTTGNISLTGTGITQAIGSDINAGSGTITYDGNAGAINLNGGTITTTNTTANAINIIDATTLSIANSITATATGAVFNLGTSGASLTGAVTQTSPLNVNGLSGNSTSTITLANAGNSIVNLVNLTSGAFTLVNNRSLTNTGTVTTSGAVNITTGLTTGVGFAQTSGGSFNTTNNSFTLNAGGGSIDFLGSLTASAITMSNATTVGLGTLTGSSLNITSAGSISDNGILPVVVSGQTTLAPGAANLITLNNAANNFATILFSNGLGATITDVNGIVIGPTLSTLGASGLSITAGGAITQSGIINAGNLSISNTVADTTLTLNNVIGTLSTISAAGRTFSFTTTVALTQSNPMTVANLVLTNTSGSTSLTNTSNQISNLGNITTTGQTFDLFNTVSLSQLNSTSILAGNARFQGSAAVSLGQGTGQTNSITGSLAASITGGNAFTYRNNPSSITTLSIGTVNGTSGITTTGAGNINITNANGNLAVGGNLTAGTTGNINLTATSSSPAASGSISGTSLLTGNILTTNSTAGTSLTNISNNVVTFNGTNTNSGNINYVNGRTAGLTVSGITQTAAGGDVSIYNRGTGALNITGLIDPDVLVLMSNGIITDSSQIITNSLITQSVGGTTLDASNNIIGSYSGSNTGGGNILVRNSDTASFNIVTYPGDGGSVAAIAGISNSGTGRVIIQSRNSSIVLGSGASITSGGIASASAASIVLVNGLGFTNNSGSTTPFVLTNGSGGNFQIWGVNRSNDVLNSLSGYSFIQYANTYPTYPTITASGLPVASGVQSGMIYSEAPTASLSLTGAIVKQYDGNATATVNTGTNYSPSGAINGDVLTFSAPSSASYPSKNVGTGLLVTASGITLTVTDSTGSKTVYGYSFNGSASGSVGQITPATLTVNGITANTKVYDTTTTATLSNTGSLSGVLGADSVTLNSGALTANFIDKNVGVNKTVNVTGYSLSGTDAGNYTLASPQTGLGTITAASLTLTGLTVSNKVYNATTTATVTAPGTLNGVLGSDTVNLNSSSLTANFVNKNVGNGKTVNVTGYALTGADAGNYTLASPQTTTANITPATLTVNGITANTKVYDTTTNATLSSTGSLSGVFGGDSVTLNSSSLTANFVDKNVGVNKTVNVTGYGISGTDAGNYTLASPQTGLGTITAATVVVNGITANTKVYDTTTTATLSSTGTLSGVLGSDSVTLNSGTLTANFNNKNVGTNKTVNVTGYSLSGTDAGNYTLASPQTGLGNITAATLVVNGITANTKVYDTTTTATLSNSGSLSGVLGGDSVNLNSSSLTANFDNKNVGTNKTVNVTGYGISGTDAGNYTLASPQTGLGNITAATVVVSGITANTKVYDATTAATLNNTGSLSGVLGSDSVTLNSSSLTANFNNKNVGTNKTVNVTGYSISGADSGNYTLASPQTGIGTITPASLTVSGITANTKVYDTTTAATLNNTGSLSGIQGSDSVTLNSSSLTANFNNKNVGTNKPVNVTGYTISGTDASNYTFSTSQSGLGNITPATLVVNGITANTRVYNGTTSATLSNTGTLSGVLGSDNVTLNSSSLTANFNNKNVGTNKTVNVTGYSVSGTDAGNYTLASPQSGLGNITPATLIVNGITANTKVYDTTTAATLSNAGSLSGVIGADNVTLDSSSLTANFANKNVGINKIVNVTGYGLTGTDAGNYTLASPQTGLGTITQAALSVNGITANTKVYDATTTATLSSTGTLNGVIGADSVTLDSSSLTANFVDKNVGNNKNVNVTGYNLSGADAANYSLASPQVGLGNITPAPLSITGVNAQNRTYDSTVNATIAGSAALSGLLGSDNVTISSAPTTGTFADKNVGNGKVVTPDSSYSITGTDSGNYTLTQPSFTANITPATITISNVTANDKVYDGTTTATINTGSINYTGIFPADAGNVTVNGTATGDFATKNVGNNIQITFSGLSLTGSEAGNYVLGNASSTTTANITPKPITVSGIQANSKNYDGTVAATFNNAGSLVGTIGGDDVSAPTAGSVLGSFDTKNVGVGKTVTVTTYNLSGADAGNYSVTMPTTTADINQANLSLTPGGTSVYGDGHTFNGTEFSQTGLASGESLTVTFNLANIAPGANVNSYSLTINPGSEVAGPGTDLNNYNIILNAGSWVVTPRPITISGITVAAKQYDATTNVSAGQINTAGYSISNIYAPDVGNVTIDPTNTTATYVDANVGVNKTVNLFNITLGGSAASNYTLQNPPSTALSSITPAPLTVIPNAGQGKVYGQADPSPLTYGVSGLQGADTQSVVTGLLARAAGENAASYAYNIAGLTASNYTLSLDNTNSFVITPAPLTLIANNASKVYGTTKTYAGTEFTVSGGTPLQFSDSIASVSLSSIGDVSTANVAGSPYSILISNAVGGGSTNLSNYTINYQSGSLTVTPASLTVNGITAQTKIYDGTTAATLSNTGSLSGVIGSDSVSLVTSGLTANFADKNVGTGKLVNITGYSITGSEASNYSISSSQVGSGDITPATLTVSGITANTKTYDTTNAATLNSVGTLSGVVGGDIVTLNSSSLTATFIDKNAGINKVINVNGYSISGDTSNYTFSSAQTGLGTITPLGITVDGITANTKTYDGTTTATLNSVGTLSGVLSGDTVSLNSSSLTANFDDKNVGIGKTVFVTGYTLGGTDGANYSLTSPQTGTGNITAANLNVNNITANTKVYDSTTAATLSSVGNLNGLASGDSVTLNTSSLTANFDDKNVGTGKSVTVTGYSISGTDAANYLFSSAQSGTGNITPASLTVTGIDAGSRVYNGTTNASLVSSGSLSGVLGSDSVTLNSSSVSASFTDKNVGINKLVNANGYSISGADAGNYTFSSAQTGIGTITAAPLTISGLAGNNKVYDSTTSATLASVGVLSGLVSGDDVNLNTSSLTAAFVDKNVGNGKTINVNGYSISGADTSNYTFSTAQTTTGNITPAPLSVTGIVADSKTYNATTTATISNVGSLSGVFGGDNIVFDTTSVVGNFVDKNVGTGKTVNVTGYGISGTDAGNYLLPSPQTTTANITPATLSVTGVDIATKTYDGNTSATFNNAGSLSGVFGGDTVIFDSASAVASFVNKNVGTGKLVNITGYSISGTDAGNYILPSPQTASGDITPASLNVTGITANTKVYDSTTAATLSATGSLNGLISGDTVTLDTSSLSASFINKNVGVNKVVNVTGYGITGTDAGNYTFSSSQTGTGTITPASLSVSGITANTKVYDTTTTATLNSVGTLSGLLGSDSVTLNSSTLTANFNNKNVGIGKPVNVTGYSISGADAGNYTFVTAQSGTGTITPASLTVTGINANSKVYDGNTSATLNTVGSLSGVLGSDSVSLNSSSLTANFIDKNVANNKTVNVSGYNISGTDAGNYTFSTVQTTQANITPAALSIASGVTANNKVYDGSINATLNVGSVAFSGIIGSDSVTLDSTLATGSFADKNVGTAKPVSTSGFALTGTDGGNYILTQPSLTANITPLTVTVANVTANSKVYDATTVATLNVGSAAITGAVGGDNLNLVTGSATGAFDGKNVGTNKSVTGSNFQLGGQDADNYILTQPTYMTADITVATINPDMTNNPTKIYDKTTTVTAPITVDPNVISGDSVTVNWSAANYDDVNVGTSKVITLSGLSLSGADAGNYILGGVTIVGQGSITPRPLANISASAASRTYDGTSIATPTVTSTLGTGNNVISGDVVQLDITNATGTFVNNVGVADPNAGVNKLVYINNLSITGADASNYMLPSPNAQTTATIFQAPLTISATSVNKVYDGNSTAPSSPSQNMDPLFGSDSISAPITQSYSDKNVGNGKTITPSIITILDGNGNVSNNYDITYVTATGNITPATLNIVGIAANNKVYDANTNASFANKGSLTGIVSGDNVTFNNTSATGTFATSNVGNGIVVTMAGYVLGGADLSNYTINVNPTTTANITPAPLTITANSLNKTYDANAFAGGNGLSYSGFVGGETSSVLSGSASFGGSSQGAVNAGAYDITPSGLSSGNYAITFVNGTLNVTPAPILIVGINGIDKVYNASIVANLDSSSFNYSGIIGSDIVNVDGSAIVGNFINKNVGANKAIILNGVTLSGADAGNYQVVYSPVTASITPATLTTHGITANDKYYDGNQSVQLNFTNAILAGVYAGDRVAINTVSYNAYFEQAGPGMNIEVYVGGLSLLGVDAMNYQLVDPSDLHASILPLPTPAPIPVQIDVSAGIIFPNWYLGTESSLIGLDKPENTENNKILVNCSNLDKVTANSICNNNGNSKKVLWTSINLNEATISPAAFTGLRLNQVYLPQ